MSVLRLACASVLVLVVHLNVLHAGTSGEVRAGETDTAETVTRPSRNQFSRTCETGMLLIENRLIEAPYQISCTVDSISLNGETFFVDPVAEKSDLRGQSQRSSGQRQRNFSPAEQFARQIFRTLDIDDVVVVLTPEIDQPFRDQLIILNGPSAKYAICSSLLGRPLNEMQDDSEIDVDRWEQVQPILKAVVPTAAQLQKMQRFVDQLDQIEARNHQQNAAIRRMDTFAYPLTVIAMVLGVFAFGHMLKWAGTTLANSDTPNSPQAIRYVEIGLLLMLGMSAIDLVWTLLAAQAGMMQELNPIAAHFVKSPMQLTIFKLLATGLGCGILYAFRNRAQMQQATWWMCLVTVLLTFRWVVFDSMMHS